LAGLLEDCSQPEAFWEQVGENLSLGRIRLVFVADEVPAELARVVSFLNAQMTPAQVLALQIRQYVGGGLKALVPQVVGQPPPAPARKRPSRRPSRAPTSAAFFALIETRRGAWEAAVAHRITGWAAHAGMRLIWDRETVQNLCRFVMTQREHDYQLFALSTAGEIEINFRWYPHQPPFHVAEKRLEFRQQLNAIPDVSLPVDVVNDTGIIPISALLSEPALRQFFGAIEWALNEIKLSWYGDQALVPLPPVPEPDQEDEPKAASALTLNSPESAAAAVSTVPDARPQPDPA